MYILPARDLNATARRRVRIPHDERHEKRHDDGMMHVMLLLLNISLYLYLLLSGYATFLHVDELAQEFAIRILGERRASRRAQSARLSQRLLS